MIVPYSAQLDEMALQGDVTAQEVIKLYQVLGQGQLDDANFASKSVGSAQLKSNALAAAWPVGSVFTSVVTTNPATLLGFGTWSQIAQGKMLVGQNASDADFDTIAETGGEKTHALITAELAAHTHTNYGALIPRGTGANFRELTDAATGDNNVASGSAGSGTAHQNMPPYYVVYFWKRTA